ncbi:hypothetical protein HBI55_098650 [Parastagonospora nodorum]|nr:hypothetical protein HBI55_098650 [Parastagonospora nodorum]
MSTLAPPARRGDLLYSSVLYADAGNANHHPRASVAELAALLRPEAPNLYTKGRKPDTSSPAKDPPWHFYSAQLIHYGLPVTKDKNGAKVRLLNAMNQFKLEVPVWVLKVEGELKKEWEAENKKMKKTSGGVVAGAGGRSKAETAPTSSPGVNVTGKPKCPEVSDMYANSLVNLSLSSSMSLSEQLNLQQLKGTTTPKKPSPSKRKRADSPPLSQAAKVKKEPWPIKRAKKEPVSKAASRMKQDSSPASTPSRSRVKQEYGSYQLQQSPYNSSPHVKTDPYAQPGHARYVLLSGTYEVNCATASDMFGDYNLELTLAENPARNAWWATFRWGAWDVIIQMSPGPDQIGVGNQCTLGWRLRDLETGQFTFGKRCTGSMTFFDNQTFIGALFGVPGVGTVEFDGNRLAGRSLEDDLRHEWDAIAAEAYGR